MRIAIALLAAVAGCMPNYTYENAQLPRLVESAPQACYEQKRLALSTGEGTWTTQKATPTFGGYIVTNTEWASQGIAFRAGASLVPAEQIVASLPDPQLAAAYEHQLSTTRGSHGSYPRWRDLSLGLAFAGLGLALGGLGITLNDPTSTAGLQVALVGAGVALVSIIPAVAASRSYKPAVAHDVDKHVFTHSEWGGRMVDAATRYNQQIAAECNYDHPDLPMTPRARQLLGIR
jgi:hypothetical protein